MIPRKIMSSLKIDYQSHWCIAFGKYVQTHEQHSNNMVERTMVDIESQTTVNRKSGY